MPAALDRLGVAERLRDVAVRNLLRAPAPHRPAAVVVRRLALVARRASLGSRSGGRDLIDQVILDAASAGATVMLASHELDRTLDLATATSRSQAAPSPPTNEAAASRGATMLRDAWLVATKDLQIEWRSRVTFGQVVPFAGLVLVLFGFALDANRPVLLQATRASSGSRSCSSRPLPFSARPRSRPLTAPVGHCSWPASNRRRCSSGSPLPSAVQLLVVEIVLLIGVVVLYSADIEAWGLVFATCLIATVGTAAAGTLLGALVAGVRARETVLPILLLPVLAPVLIGATRAFDDARIGGCRRLVWLSARRVRRHQRGPGSIGTACSSEET